MLLKISQEEEMYTIVKRLLCFPKTFLGEEMYTVIERLLCFHISFLRNITTSQRDIYIYLS